MRTAIRVLARYGDPGTRDCHWKEHPFARMGSERRADYLAKNPLESFTSQTPTTMWRLEKDLVDPGPTHSDQQFRYGITCAAASLAPEGSSLRWVQHSRPRGVIDCATGSMIFSLMLRPGSRRRSVGGTQPAEISFLDAISKEAAI